MSRGRDRVPFVCGGVWLFMLQLIVIEMRGNSLRSSVNLGDGASSTVVLEITRNCPCVVSRSQENNSGLDLCHFRVLSAESEQSAWGWSCTSRVRGAAWREAARNMVVRGER